MTRRVCGLVVMCFVAAIGFQGRLGSAQQSSTTARGAETLPPDVYPDTLSREPRVKESDFTTEEDKRSYEQVLAISPTSAEWNTPGAWMGPTGTRAQIPELAVLYLQQGLTIRKRSGLEPKYIELTILVATRECNYKSEFLDHQSREVTRKALDPKVIDIIKNEKDTKGLEEKEALIIQFGREVFHQPKVSSQTFAHMERTFGRKTTLAISLLMGYYATNELIMRVYDQQLYRKPGEKAPASPW